MALTIEQLNTVSPDESANLLEGVYEHSPWIARRAMASRPFRSLAHLKQVLAHVVSTATEAEQLGLIKAHPELAGKAMVSKTLTAESTNEQGKAGLTECTPEEFEKIQQLNSDYNARFGFPFILCIRRHTRESALQAFEQRLRNDRATELAGALDEISAITRLRLDRFMTDVSPVASQGVLIPS